MKKEGNKGKSVSKKMRQKRSPMKGISRKEFVARRESLRKSYKKFGIIFDAKNKRIGRVGAPSLNMLTLNYLKEMKKWERKQGRNSKEMKKSIEKINQALKKLNDRSEKRKYASLLLADKKTGGIIKETKGSLRHLAKKIGNPAAWQRRTQADRMA